MSTSDDQSQPNRDWEQLQAQLGEVEERADAVFNNNIQQTAMDIRDILDKVVPPEFLAAFTSPERKAVSIDDLPIGVDGQPVVRNADEALAVRAARPEIDDIVTKLINSRTVASRQQLALDIKRAEAAGDQARLNELATKQDKLNEKADRLGFFSTMAALHPVTPDYFNDCMSDPIDRTLYTSYSVETNEDQVSLFDTFYTEYEYIRDYLRRYSPRNLEFLRQQAEEGNDEVSWNRSDALEGDVAEKAVALNQMRKIMDDIATGFASVYAAPDKALPDAPKKVVGATTGEIQHPELEQYYDMLKATPGIDPVRYIVQGRYHELPQEGWIIVSHISPGRDGEIDLIRVKDGGYSVSDSGMSIDRPYVSVQLETFGAASGTANIIYRHYTPNTGSQRLNVEDFYEDVTELSTGSNLFVSAHPVRATDQAFGGMRYQTITSSDVDYERRSPSSWKVDVARITDDADQAQEIIRQLGLAMGMTEEDAAFVINKFDALDSFAELKARTAEETQKLLAPKENVIRENSDGSKIVERCGNEYMVETDGTEWLLYSVSSGLHYSGPDDMAGYYSE